jgi:ectoine hydroxylase-related dioxygenase (phytanoyl-CoA dioxygenase family)
MNNLPDLDTPFALLDQHISDYQKNRVTLVRSLAHPEEIAQYRLHINEAVARYNTETRALKDRDTYGMAFLQTMNLWLRDEAVRRFSCAKRFAKVAAELMGVSGVRMYHDQALYKEPGGGLTPWHQDQHYWPLDTNHTITMWMPLLDVSAEIGTLSFALGSHHDGYLGDIPIGDAAQSRFAALVKEKSLEIHTYGAMQAGDATFHSGWVLHMAPPNPSPSFRREVMTVIYVDENARVAAPANPSQSNDLEQWLPGLKAGDAINSPLNPVLYTNL